MIERMYEIRVSRVHHKTLCDRFSSKNHACSVKMWAKFTSGVGSKKPKLPTITRPPFSCTLIVRRTSPELFYSILLPLAQNRWDSTKFSHVNHILAPANSKLLFCQIKLVWEQIFFRLDLVLAVNSLVIWAHMFYFKI